MINRKAKIKLIHTIKHKLVECVSCSRVRDGNTTFCECGQADAIPLPDKTYRNILERYTGVTTCNLMDDSQLALMADKFISMTNQQEEYVRALGRLIYAIRHKAPEVLGDSWERRIQGFTKKMGRASLRDCNHQELRKIHGWLSRKKKQQEGDNHYGSN